MPKKKPPVKKASVALEADDVVENLSVRPLVYEERERLKEIFADRPILEIHSSRPVDVMKALDQMDEVQKTTLFGTAVHAVLKPGRIDVAALRDRLEAQGFEIRAIDRVMASLEDVFLDVVERAS